MTKRAFLVVGPESSGTRLMTKILIRAGCYGMPGHEQEFDKELPTELNPIVWRRSFPHTIRHEWPNLSELVASLSLKGYSSTAVVTMRDWKAILSSQVKSRDSVNSLGAALKNIRLAYAMIFAYIVTEDMLYVMSSYESIVKRPIQAISSILDILGLSNKDNPVSSWIPDIYDGNAKWYNEGKI